MSKRITIMLDDDLDRALRDKQAAMIKKHKSSFSFSRVLNEVLRGTTRLK